MDQRMHTAYWLEKEIDKALEVDEESKAVELSMSTALAILSVLKSQQIPEPMMDIVMFAGRPTHQTRCYHVLVNEDDYNEMQKDPNIGFVSITKFNGVMRKEFMIPLTPVEKDGFLYCRDCGARILNRKFRPYACGKCGRKFDWNVAWLNESDS